MFAENSAPLDIEHDTEHELPNLLDVPRRRRPSKTLCGPIKICGPRKLAPESKSTGGLHGSLESNVSCESIESSKSLHVGDQKSKEELWSTSSEETHTSPCNKAFPVKPAPLQRWHAAAKLQKYISKWRARKGMTLPTEPETQKVEVAECSAQPWVQYWPEEPDAPTREDLEELTELESMMMEHHGSMEAAYKFVTNSSKGSGNAEKNLTKLEFRIALHLKASKDSESRIKEVAQSPSGHKTERFERMFDRLCTLLRKRGGEISKTDFLRFPELLKREKDLQAHLSSSSGLNSSDANMELLIGSRLRRRLMGPIKSSKEALELLQRAGSALQLEPCRTSNLLFQIGSAPCNSANPGGLKVAISNIMNITRRHGAPLPGVQLQVLQVGWTLCRQLTKQVIALGPPPAAQLSSLTSTKSPTKASKSSMSLSSNLKAKAAAKIGRKYQSKVTKVEICDESGEHENECKQALWQALPTDEVVWTLASGAEVLKDEDFKNLLQNAWGLFDDFDAVGSLLGPVGWSRMRPKLEALAALNLERHALGRDPGHALSQLQNANVLLQQIASMCEADPRQARIAALFGASLVADRIRSTANSSVNFAEEAVGAAAAQVNRSVEAVSEMLLLHMEELLGSRKVECRFSGGSHEIVPVATTVRNPLAEWHQSITAAALAKATVKGDDQKPVQKVCSEPGITAAALSKATVKEDDENPVEKVCSEPRRLRPCDAFLLGYNNL